MAKQMLKFVRHDRGFCRVYYRGAEDRKLYCVQEDSRGVHAFYACSKDGEPEVECTMPILARFDQFIEP